MPALTPLDDTADTKWSVVAYKKNQRVKKALLHLYQDGPCTLAKLAEVLHTSIPSATNIIDQLVAEGWVSTIGTVSGNNGRRPVLYSLNPVGHYVLIVDSNTQGIKLSVVTLMREIIVEYSNNTVLEDNPDFSAFLGSFVNDTLIVSGIAKSDIIGVGLSMPGLIDSRHGLNLSYTNLGIPGQSLTGWLEKQWRLPVFMINDTKATALGEHRFGSGRGKQHALAINIDWGVGLGIIINGEVFQGASGFAGELGHIQVDPDGELCYCGKIGCLDTLTSASSLVRRVQQGVQGGKTTQLAIYGDDPEQITINHVIRAADLGDGFTIDLLHETGYELGKGLSIAITLFNPEVIIVDGVLAEASLFLTNSMKQAINKYCLSGFRDNLTIEVTTLAGAAKWLGTHAYVIENLFVNM